MFCLTERYTIPDSNLDQDSLLINIAVDTRTADCSDAHAYLSDVTSFKLIGNSIKMLPYCIIYNSITYYPNINSVFLQASSHLFPKHLNIKPSKILLLW